MVELRPPTDAIRVEPESPTFFLSSQYAWTQAMNHLTPRISKLFTRFMPPRHILPRHYRPNMGPDPNRPRRLDEHLCLTSAKGIVRRESFFQPAPVRYCTSSSAEGQEETGHHD